MENIIEDYSPVQKRIVENRDVLQKAIVGFMISSSTLDLMERKVVHNAEHLELLKVDAELSKQLQTFPVSFMEGVAMCPERTRKFHQALNMIDIANKEVANLIEEVKGVANGN